MLRSRIRLPAFWVVIACSLLCGLLYPPVQAHAADAGVVVVPPAPKVSQTPPVEHRAASIRNKDVEYGCKRIWRCDEQVCEWRRGCWGIYGYMEGPYYSVPLARRQWQMDGWPTSSR